MLGVVLCGGKSTRMGSDKGLLPFDAKNWTEHAIDKLVQLDMNIVVSVSALQSDNYAAFVPAERLLTDDTTLNVHGPLGGLLSVHQRFLHEDLFILACDMPLMKVELMKELVRQYVENKLFDAYLFTNEEEYEPLCGIYTSKALAKILSMHHAHQLRKHSMKHMLEQLKVWSIEIPEDKKEFFRNFNSHAELNGM